jgi:hypothetical protein
MLDSLIARPNVDIKVAVVAGQEDLIYRRWYDYVVGLLDARMGAPDLVVALVPMVGEMFEGLGVYRYATITSGNCASIRGGALVWIKEYLR